MYGIHITHIIPIPLYYAHPYIMPTLVHYHSLIYIYYHSLYALTPPQVFHRTPAYDDGSLCPGDELVSVNGVSLKGLSRKQTADVIQAEKVVTCTCTDSGRTQFHSQ